MVRGIQSGVLNPHAIHDPVLLRQLNASKEDYLPNMYRLKEAMEQNRLHYLMSPAEYLQMLEVSDQAGDDDFRDSQVLQKSDGVCRTF